MELAFNSLFAGGGSWTIGKVYMEDTKTSKNYDIIHKSASFFKKSDYLGDIFKKFRAYHTGFFFSLDRRMFEMYKTFVKNVSHLCPLPLFWLFR